MQQWHWLRSEVLKPHSLEILKDLPVQLHVCDLYREPALAGGLDSVISRCTLQPH